MESSVQEMKGLKSKQIGKRTDQGPGTKERWGKGCPVMDAGICTL